MQLVVRRFLALYLLGGGMIARAGQSPEAVQSNLDLAWILIASALVFFMQAGFAALETGMIRAKNSLNVAAKNTGDILVAALLFFLTGYALMFGDSADGLFGTSGFLLGGVETPFEYAFFLFQLVFAGTAATIVSGAVAERMRFGAYLVISAAVTGLIYPVSGHWVWGDGGWLAGLGFVDFAGSTVVHALGGWVGLVGAWLLGPRLGRLAPDGTAREIPPHNLLLTAIGVFILWLGWFGFNGGSTLSADGSIAVVLVNTFLAAAAGGIAALLLIPHNAGTRAISGVLNGIVGGLVGITAGAAAVSPGGAILIGLVAGGVVVAGEWFVLHVLRVDDPVGAVSAHAFAGAWGTLAVALFAPVAELPMGDRLAQLGVQGVGVLAVAAWGLGTGAVVFGLLRAMGRLRVPEEDEERGLNEAEHGARTVWLDTLRTMQAIARERDLSQRAPVEPHTEAGEVAQGLNGLLKEFAGTFGAWQGETGRVSAAGDQLAGSAESIADSARDSADRVERVRASVSEADTVVQDVVAQIQEVSRSARHANERTQTGRQAVERAATGIRELRAAGERVEGANRTIRDIAERTDLLALNAAIEAANAGEAGQGFGVVADEVRALAHQTAQATSEVGGLLAELQQRASDSAEAVDGLQTAMQDMAAMVDQTDQSADRIAGGAEQLAATMHEAAGETAGIAESVGTVARHGEEVRGASRELGELALGLRRSLAVYRLPEEAEDTSRVPGTLVARSHVAQMQGAPARA
ncbi:ammonium transporter [Thiohalorhabdus methylotrophus]|uniref:Ammonium transporter n=1 Tax=Thiohalorhabdus methylotrophus TaxID=3242694 RepID=A0ABV4TS38_9GAMM